MRTRTHTKRWFIVLLALISLIACRKDFERISTSQWEPELALPFIQADFTLGDIIGSDSNLYNNPDSSYYYVYQRDSAIVLTIDSVYTPPDNITGDHQFSLGELTYDDFQITKGYDLYDLIPYIDEESADSLLANDGYEAIFPDIYVEYPFSIELDPVSEFVSLNISEGSMELTVDNLLPVAIQDIQLEIWDTGEDELLSEVDIAYIDLGGSASELIQLDGETISNLFEIRVASLGSPGSEPETVLINLEDGLMFHIQTTGIKVIAGEGTIEEQMVISDTCVISFEPEGGEQLFHIDAASAFINTTLSTDLTIDVRVEIILPAALVGDQVLVREITMNNGAPTEDEWEVADVSLDLTTGGDTPFNTFPVIYNITLLPTESYIVFDSSFKVNTSIGLQEIELDFADGNLGMQNINMGAGSLDLELNFLDQFQGEIILEDPELHIEYSNGFGIPLKMLADITGINSTDGLEQSLNADFVTVECPEEPGNLAEGAIVFNKENSSVVDLLAIRPDKVNYELGGITNWNEQEYNFVTSSSHIVLNTRMEVPLVLRSDDLHFTDTVEIEMPGSYLEMKEGIMLAKVTNGFPFDMKIHLTIPDALTGVVLETLEFTNVPSAPVGPDGKVTEPHFCEATGVISETFFSSMENAEFVILLIEAVTYDNGNVPVALCSDYELNVALGFELAVKP